MPHLLRTPWRELVRRPLAGGLALLGWLLLPQLGHTQTVTIPAANTNTTTSRYPLTTYYGYTRTAAIYTATEIGTSTGGTITSVGYYLQTASSPDAVPVKVYVKTVGTATGFTANTTVAAEESGATLVYNATVPASQFVAGTWVTLPFSTNFVYNGTDNLEVIVETNYGGSGGPEGSTGKLFRFSNGATRSFQYWEADTSPPTSTGTRQTSRANMQLGFLQAGCTGTPAAGTAAASPATICSGTSTISLSGGTTGSGITYQLQSSVSSTGPYTNVGTASTTSSFTVTPTVTTYYRIGTTCANSALTSYTSPVSVTFNAPTYAAVPYTQTFEATWTSACGTRDVPDASWRSNPLSGNNAWRRYDDGAAGGWSSTSGAYTPAGSNAAGASSANSARFHSYNASSGTQGILDLYVNVSGGTGTPTLKFDYINPTGADKMEVLFSTDGGATFGTPIFTPITSAVWNDLTISLPGATATTVVRFRATSDYGDDDIGLDNVSVSRVSCSPVTALTAGSITTTSASLSFIAPSGASSYTVTYTPTGGTAQTVTPAPTTSPVPLSGLTPGTTYAVSVVTNCGGGSTSTAATTSFTTAYPCPTPTYATLPYTQGFEGTYLSSCALRDVPDGSWKISPVSGENAWRRYDDGAAANWTNTSGGAYTPAGSNAGGASSANSARFHSYFASSGTQGTFDLYVNASGAGTPTLTFDYLNTSGTDKLEVLLSTDGGATFGSALFTQVLAANWTTYTVPLTGATATSVVRFRATSDYGATDIGLDNVGVSLISCSPVTALTAGSITSTSASLSFTAPSGASSYTVTYTPTGGTATTVSPAPTASPVPLSGLTPGTTYAVSVVTNCGGGSTSTAATATFTTAYACVTPTYAALPYTQTFEGTWVSNCALRDVPSLNWKLTPGATDPDASFRRYDDGVAAGWTNGSTNYGYTPAGSNAGGASSTYSARYHSGNVYPVTEFALFDLYVNASGGTGTPTLTFDYINTDGSDQLQVFLSTDGGATFGSALFTQVVSAAWTTYTVPLAGATATSVVRFKAMGDNGSTDIGLDNVSVSLVSCGAVTALTAGSITSTSAQLTFTAPSGASSYVVTYTPTGGTATTVSPAPTASPVPLSGLTPGTTYAVSVVTNCGGSTSTAATTSFTTAYSCVTPTYASLPYTQAFESTYLSNCALRDVPSANWKSTPVSGNNAWRRYDDGTAGGWSSTGGAYTPAGSNAGGATSANSARFHSYDATSGLQGLLDLYVNASGGASTPALTFDYINTSGTDKLEVLLSTDGGATFGAALFSQTLAANWTTYTVPLTGATATTVVRFRATSDYGFTDLGLDNVSVAALPDLVVDGTNSSSGTPYSASGTYNNVTINSGGTASLSGSLTVNGTLTINSGGTLNTVSSQVLGAGNFVLAAGGTLGIGGAAGITVGPATTGVIRNTGTTRSYSTDANYVYNGTAAQSTGAGLPSQVRNLTTTNANTVTLTAPTSATQVVTVGGAGNLALNGQALTLLSNASGTALIVNSGTGLVTGATGVAQRYLATSNQGNGYRQYSAPVSGSTVADLATGSFSPTVNPAYNTSATPATVRPFPTVYGYDQSRLASTTNNLTPFNKGWYSPNATSDPLAVGQGYTVQIAGTQLVDFVGTFTSGNQNVALSRGPGADAGLALVGNPYPAPMDWSLLDATADRPGVDGAIYVFASSGPYAGSYRSYANGQGGNPIVPMGQGFFVRVTPGQSSGTLAFKNTHRLTAPDATPMQRTQDLRPQLVLELRTPAGAADPLYAYAEAGATAGMDAEFDAFKLSNPSGLNLSSAAATGEPLAIDGRADWTAATELPLQVGVPAAGTYTLHLASLTNLPASLTPYLRDAATGQTLPLVVGQGYSFSVTATQATALLTGRFTLVFRSTGALAATPAALAAAVSLYPNPAGKAGFTVGVPAVAGASQVQAELLNALGQVVGRQSAALPAAGTALSFPTSELAGGVYMLRLTAGAATVTKRVVVE